MKKIDGILNKTDKTKAKNGKTIQQLGQKRCCNMCKHWSAEDLKCEFLEGHTRLKLRECSRYIKEHPDLKTELRCPDCHQFLKTVQLSKVIENKSAMLMCSKCGREHSMMSFVEV